jgi:hypothetical protein
MGWVLGCAVRGGTVLWVALVAGLPGFADERTELVHRR